MNALEKKVLSSLKPTPEEERKFKEAAGTCIAQIVAKLPECKVILGGSGEKNTWLAGNFDVDLFVQFPLQKYASKSSTLAGLLEGALKKAFPRVVFSRLHGSRDYFQFQFAGFQFEVVPILGISKAEDALNITDVSPLHALWVKKQAKSLTDEIRLAKQFCRAQKVYGAESYLSGFSGYVLEIMVIYYGSFQKLLAASQKWKKKEVIDAGRHYPKGDALFHLNTSKTRSPLVVVDPVDKNRNAAAALSQEKVSLFVQKAKEYLAKPSEKFFEAVPITPETIPYRKNEHAVFIELTPLEGKQDVVGSKLLKVFEYVQRKLRGFEVVRTDWDWNVGYVVVRKQMLPEFEVRTGPPVTMKEAVVAFRKKNKVVFEEKGVLKAKIQIKVRDLAGVCKSVLKDAYVTERIGKVVRIIFT